MGVKKPPWGGWL